jgi:hypothetical protein
VGSIHAASCNKNTLSVWARLSWRGRHTPCHHTQCVGQTSLERHLGCPLLLTFSTMNSAKTLKETAAEANALNILRKGVPSSNGFGEATAILVRAQGLCSGSGCPTIAGMDEAMLYSRVAMLAGTVRFFRLRFTLEGVIEFHAFAPIQAIRRVTNSIPLGCSLLLPVKAVNSVQTRKVNCSILSECSCRWSTSLPSTRFVVRCAFFDRSLHPRSAIELHAFAPLEALPGV